MYINVSAWHCLCRCLIHLAQNIHVLPSVPKGPQTPQRRPMLRILSNLVVNFVELRGLGGLCLLPEIMHDLVHSLHVCRIDLLVFMSMLAQLLVANIH
jgi:hypothetical protein